MFYIQALAVQQTLSCGKTLSMLCASIGLVRLPQLANDREGGPSSSEQQLAEVLPQLQRLLDSQRLVAEHPYVRDDSQCLLLRLSFRLPDRQRTYGEDRIRDEVSEYRASLSCRLVLQSPSVAYDLDRRKVDRLESTRLRSNFRPLLAKAGDIMGAH